MDNKITLVANFEEADVITHGTVFHADDAMALAILSMALNRNLKLLRTNDRIGASNYAKNNNNKIVFDIGGGKFDHHFKEDDKKLRTSGIPYASCGLIFKEYGMKAIANILFEANINYVLCDTKLMENIWEKVDLHLMEGIDAIDNGVNLEKTNTAKVNIVNISRYVSMLNPTWNENASFDDRFLEAFEFSCLLLKRTVITASAEFESYDIVKRAINQSKDKRILVLDRYCSWQEALIKLDRKKTFLYAIFLASDGNYKIQAVPYKAGAHSLRKPLPEKWRGLSGEDIIKASKIEDAIFCHASGFIASTTSKASAIKMAEIAVKA